MVQSMTGFASVVGGTPSRRLSLDIKSLNSKGLDVRLLANKEYTSWEQRFIAALRERFTRGRFELCLQVTELATELPERNLVTARRYHAILETLRRELGIVQPITLDHLLHFEEFTALNRNEEDLEAVWTELHPLLNRCLDQLATSRKREGEIIAADMAARMTELGTCLDRIETELPRVNAQLRANLLTRLAETRAEVAAERFEQEVVYYLARCDVTEEVVRARAHQRQFLAILSNSDGEPQGKRLGFLLQELQREFNTLGSKAASIDIANLVINSKVELEKIREQLQNLE